MNKLLRIIGVIPFLSCNLSHIDDNQTDNFIQNVLKDPQSQYSLKGVVDTLDSIPLIALNMNDRWIFHLNIDSYNDNGEESVAGAPDTLTVSNLTDSTITFNCSNHFLSDTIAAYNCNKVHQLINNITFLNNLHGEPLPPNGYKYSKMIKMDDGTYSFSVEIDTITYEYISDQKIINSKYGVLYEKWNTSTGPWDGHGGYLALLKKNDVDVPLGKKLNEFYAKDSVLK